MFEMMIAVLIGVACGRVLDWYHSSASGPEGKAGTEAAGEEIPVTEAKSE